MNKHKELLKDKFQHAEEDLIYNTGGGVMWSLFRFSSGGVTVYYHETDDYYIINRKDAQHYTLEEIADGWNPVTKQII